MGRQKSTDKQTIRLFWEATLRADRRLLRLQADDNPLTQADLATVPAKMPL